MILLQDQFDDIIGKSDLDNLNQISIYHNSNSRNSNKYYENSNKCYDFTNIGYSHRICDTDYIAKDYRGYIFSQKTHFFTMKPT